MDINYYKKFEPIDGKWYINKELGSGAYGTVFEIQRKDFPDMKSALKIISIPMSQNEVDSYREENFDLDEKSVTSYFYGFVEEFVKEFILMARLKGQSNIVSYEDHDVIKKENGIGWDIFIRMELLTPMNRFFVANTPKEIDVIRLGIDICKALEVCQKYKIIHRDIKPSNIFVSETGDFKLGDFGVARTLEKTSSGLSKKGTYTYMAPEVYKGQSYGSNVDIYSLGIVMYKLLNDNLEPFRHDRTYADSENAMMKRMNGEVIPKPKNAQGRLAEIVLKACSFDPKERYESPLQMRCELENIQYAESERKIINPNGDEFDYEPSAGTNDNSDVGIVDDYIEKTTSFYEATVGANNGTECGYEYNGRMQISETQENIPFTTYAINSYVSMWKRIVDFKGVTSRKAYWSAVLVNAVVTIILMIAILVTGGIMQPLCQLYVLATFIPGLSMCTRRLHDTGRSGHWQWLFLTVYGSIAVLVFCCMQGKKENNKYLNRLSEDK